MAGGSELGSAHVSIFPQMKGFRQNVAKETGKAVSDMKTPSRRASMARSRASRSAAPSKAVSTVVRPS